MFSTLKNMKYMQRAAQREGKTAKILEEIASDMNLICYTPPKRCVVIMEGDPHPPIKGRMLFNPEASVIWSTCNNEGRKRKQTGEDAEVLYPRKLRKSMRAKLWSCARSSQKGVRLSKETLETLAPCRKVYVGGIPLHSSEDDIWSYFEGCGTITRLHCMKSPESGDFIGIALIKFKTDAAAKRALALDGSVMDGLYLKIRPYKKANKASPFAQAIVEGYNRIYVGNLPWEITEDDLRDFFSDCAITSVWFAKDKETAECKGYGHVDFADSESVETALNLDRNIVCGRPIRISRAVAKKGAVTSSTPFRQKTISYQIKSEGSKPREPNTNFNQPRSNGTNVVAPVPVSWKMRSRKCFVCREKGHISSACLLKQPTGEAEKRTVTGSTPFQERTISNQLKSEDSKPPEPNSNSNQPRSHGTNVLTPVPVSCKIVYKVCYVCKEKGHISSSCPKRQSTVQS